MKILQIPCPNCGGKLNIDEDKAVCTHCGAEFPIDNEEKNVNININKRDEARIRESERREKVRLRELENEEKQKTREHKEWKWFWIGWAAFMIICFGTLFFMAESEKPNENEVAMPVSSSSYEGDNYKQVIQELENVGFSNIQTSEKPDLVTGWITKDGDVDRVSINGDYDFDEGDIFPKDATVVVTYHTFEK